MSASNFVRVAAAVMVAGIGLGAFGAHGFKEILEQNGRVDVWSTAVKYHLVHGVALFALALSTYPAKGGPFWCWAGGILLFSGSLYALALTNRGLFGAVPVFGGILFLIGWGWLIFKPGEGRN